MLLCCSHPDYKLPDVTFNLWYRLSAELYTRNVDSLVAVFKGHIERLIVSLCRHCQMEPDTQGVLEEGEDSTAAGARPARHDPSGGAAHRHQAGGRAV